MEVIAKNTIAMPKGESEPYHNIKAIGGCTKLCKNTHIKTPIADQKVVSNFQTNRQLILNQHMPDMPIAYGTTIDTDDPISMWA